MLPSQQEFSKTPPSLGKIVLWEVLAYETQIGPSTSSNWGIASATTHEHSEN